MMSESIAENIVKEINGQIRGFRNLFYVQLHITADCTEDCKHCYLDKTKISEMYNLETCKDIIDQIVDLAAKKRKFPYIAFIGGDPLLHPHIDELIKYARGKKVNVVIKGNPWLLTEEKVQSLKNMGIARYHLSLDGLQNTHDSIRREGSFNRTIEAIKLLTKHNISTLVKSTVSTSNISEMKDLLVYANAIGVDAFDFQRYAPTSSENAKYMVSGLQYKNLLCELLETYKEIRVPNNKMHLLYRDHLWMLLFRELDIINDDLLTQVTSKDQTICGCSMANGNILVINYDGNVTPCAKVPNYIIGNVFESKISNIIDSNKFKALRSIENYSKCSKCKLSLMCRGCPAIAYYKNNNVFDADPQCWLDV